RRGGRRGRGAGPAPPRCVREPEPEGRTVLDELRRRPEPGALRAFVHAAGESIATRARETAADEVPGRPPAPGDQVEIVGRGIRGELVEIAGERAASSAAGPASGAP